MATRKKTRRGGAPAATRTGRFERTWKDTRRALRTAEASVGKRLAELRQRARRDGRSLSRGVDDAVARALAALNIPSRLEVQELSRRVEQLSARVDRLRR